MKFLQGNVPREFASSPVVMGSTPGWGTKITKAMRHGDRRTEKRKKKQMYQKANELKQMKIFKKIETEAIH